MKTEPLIESGHPISNDELDRIIAVRRQRADNKREEQRAWLGHESEQENQAEAVDPGVKPA